MNYFVTSGKGQSNLLSSNNETTSYDSAIVNAGLPNINIVTVSSMIPPNSIEIKGFNYRWGEIVFCIMARKDSTRGKFISCALMIAEVYQFGKLLGSFVLEYSGSGSEETAKRDLLAQLKEMAERRGVVSRVKRFIYNSLKVNKRFGTVLCLVCFKN
jgi:arginine decarboxylase